MHGLIGTGMDRFCPGNAAWQFTIAIIYTKEIEAATFIGSSYQRHAH